MGLFNRGSKTSKQDEVARLDALPLPDLADHLMSASWGAEGAEPDGGTLTEMQVIRLLSPGLPSPKMVPVLQRLTATGMTALSNAGLALAIVGDNSDSSSRRWEPTPAGTTALAADRVREIVAAAHPGI